MADGEEDKDEEEDDDGAIVSGSKIRETDQWQNSWTTILTTSSRSWTGPESLQMSIHTPVRYSATLWTDAR